MKNILGNKFLFIFLILSFLIPSIASASYTGTTKEAFILSDACGTPCSAVGNSATEPMVTFVYDSVNGANSSGSYVQFNHITAPNNKFYHNQTVSSTQLQAIAGKYGYTSDANGVTSLFGGTAPTHIEIIGKVELDKMKVMGGVNSSNVSTYYQYLLDSSSYPGFYQKGDSYANNGGNTLTFIDKSVSDVNLVDNNNTLTNPWNLKNVIGNGAVLNTQARKFVLQSGLVDGFVIPANPVGNTSTIYYMSPYTNLYNSKLDGAEGLATSLYYYGGSTMWYLYSNPTGYYEGTTGVSAGGAKGKVVNSFIVFTGNSNGYNYLPLLYNSYVSIKNNQSFISHIVSNSIIDGNGGTGGVGIAYNATRTRFVNMGAVVTPNYNQFNLYYNNGLVVIMPGTVYSNVFYNNSKISFNRGSSTPTNSYFAMKQSSSAMYPNWAGKMSTFWIYHNVFYNNSAYSMKAPSLAYVDVGVADGQRAGVFTSPVTQAETLLDSNLITKMYNASYVTNLLQLIDNNNDSVNETSFPFLYKNLIKANKPAELVNSNYCVNESTVGKKTDNTPCAFTSYNTFSPFLGNTITINSSDNLNTISY